MYRPSPSWAAKNIINLISVLAIWWCPCIESSLTLLEEDVGYDQCKALYSQQKLYTFSKLYIVYREDCIQSAKIRSSIPSAKTRPGADCSSDGKVSACNGGDLGSIPGSGISPGEGNGKPLQYCCLESWMDGGAWFATVHGIIKSRTQLSNFTGTGGNKEFMIWATVSFWSCFWGLLELLHLLLQRI